VVSRILARKLSRDLWRQRWQFLAVALIIAIGIAVYVAASDAYRNLQQSFDRAYATQLLPDAILSGPGAADLRDQAQELPGEPVVAARRQGDVGIRINGHTLLGRVVGMPAQRQPAVSRLAVRSGSLPGAGEVVVEQHLTDHYRLRPGDTVQLLTPTGWRTMRVSGSALSTEYFWPARSQQEIMTTPEHFGVVFATDRDVQEVLADPVDQLLLYARDRDAAPALTSSASRLAQTEGLLFASRDDQPSYRALQDDVEAVGTFANLLPWLFLAAAVLGTYVLLSRLVAAQRAVIGTLAANGVSSRSLRQHYLAYGVAAGLAGAVPGLVGGYYLGGWFTTQYTDALGLPLHVTSLHPVSLVVGAAVGTAAAALAAWAPARAAARTSPAEAMRVSLPGVHGGLSLAERIAPPLRRLPARWRMTLRGILRNRRRTVLTVLGVAVSVSLVMVFAGLRDTVATVIDRQYGAIQLEDAEVRTAPDAAAAVLTALRADPGVAAAEPFGRYDVTLGAAGRQYQTLLLALPPETQMHRFTSGDSERTLPAEGVLLGQGARETLGVEVGELITVAVTQTGQRLPERVVGLVDEPMNPVAYMSMRHLSQTTAAPAPSGVLLKLKSAAAEETVSGRVAAMPGVVAYLSTATVATAMRETFTLYDALVGLMLAFAA
jgi:putative ABC transport system permease protein